MTKYTLWGWHVTHLRNALVNVVLVELARFGTVLKIMFQHLEAHIRQVQQLVKSRMGHSVPEMRVEWYSSDGSRWVVSRG